MTDDTMQPSDHVYYGIRSLKGWDRTLETAQHREGGRARHVGVLISNVLLAGGENRMPVAVAGELDKTGSGSLAVLHGDVVVIATARDLGSGDATTKVTVHPLSDVTIVEVQAHHNYFDGTARRPRYADLRVQVAIGGHSFTFADRGTERTKLTDGAAVNEALDTIRSGLTR